MKFIRKDALISHIEVEAERYGEEYDAWQILGDIEDFPEIEAEPIQEARWFLDGDDTARCSNCKTVIKGEAFYWRNNYYCYHCGAKMFNPGIFTIPDYVEGVTE